MSEEAAASDQSASPPSTGFGQFSAVVDGRLVVCGGMIEGVSRENLNLKYVYVFDPSLEYWTRHSSTGDHPNVVLFYGASVGVNQFFYMYGGKTDDYHSFGFSSYYGGLHCLDVRKFVWTTLSEHPWKTHTLQGPTAKVHCRMLHYESMLVLYGGRRTTGHSIGLQPGASYDRGFTNEIHTFDLSKNSMWSSPRITGTQPPPCVHPSFTKVDHCTAVLFGGGVFEAGELRETNHLYILDLQTMHWSGVSHDGIEPWPFKRQDHVSLCLSYNAAHSQLLVMGGETTEEECALDDMCLLDLKSMCWKIFSSKQRRHLRYGHDCAAAFDLSQGRTKVVVYEDNNFQVHPAAIFFGMMSLQELCLAVIKSALQWQKLLKSDQLVSKLPSFLSPHMKLLIIQNL